MRILEADASSLDEAVQNWEAFIQTEPAKTVIQSSATYQQSVQMVRDLVRAEASASASAREAVIRLREELMSLLRDDEA